jgi:hypothetical protein
MKTTILSIDGMQSSGHDSCKNANLDQNGVLAGFRPNVRELATAP